MPEPIVAPVVPQTPTAAVPFVPPAPSSVPVARPNLPVGHQDVSDLIAPPESAEYVAKMLAVADANDALNNTGKALSPEMLAQFPDKFKNAADPMAAMLASYKELEKKLGGPQTTPAEADPAKPAVTTPPAAVPSPGTPVEEVKSYLTETGIDFDALNATFTAQGSFTDAQYAELGEVGLPKHVVDAYITGQKAVMDKRTNDILSTAGGREAYVEMITWAKDALPPAEIQAFNEIVQGGNDAHIKLAITALSSQFKAGGPPKLLQGSTTNPGTTVTGYASENEVVQAMADPRYRTDVAYQREVAVKMSNSKGIFGG